MVALDKGTNNKLIHIDLRHTGREDLMLAHTMLCLCHRQNFQGNNTLSFPCVGKELSRPHRVSQTTTVIDISANLEMTEYFPVNISELLPVTNREFLQI